MEEATQVLALARRVAQLDSPHLTPVVACGLTAEGGTFVVYESPVLGKPLGARGEAGKKPAPAALPLLFDRALAICAGLAVLHRAGLVAETLHEGNLEDMPEAREGGSTAPAGIRLRLPTLPKGRSFLSRIMPPEVLRGDADSTEQGDIWLLGELLFQLFCGRASFDDQKFLAYRRILYEAPIDPRILRPDLPPAIAALLLRCLDKQPSRRPQSVAEVAAEFFPFRSAENTWAQPLAPASTAPRPLRLSLDEMIATYEDFAEAASAPLTLAAQTASVIPPRGRGEQQRFNHAAAYYVRGSRRFHSAEPSAAEADFQRALCIDPCYRYARALAVCQLNRSDPAAAQQSLLRARSYLHEHEHDPFGFDAASLLAPAETSYLEGLAAVQQGDADGALAAFTKALVAAQPKPTQPIDPTILGAAMARFYAARSVVLHQRGRFAEAVADCDEALRHQPGRPELLFSRGLSLYALGKYKKAIVDYSAAIAAQPDSGEYYYCRSLAYQRAGHQKSAAADQRLALDLGFSGPAVKQYATLRCLAEDSVAALGLETVKHRPKQHADRQRPSVAQQEWQAFDRAQRIHTGVRSPLRRK